MKYVAIAKQAGGRTRVYGVFRSFEHALDYSQHADPINATWSVCELIEEETPREHNPPGDGLLGNESGPNYD